MADEDEIDVLGDFSLDNLLCKNDSGISCYDNSVLSSQNSELLGCDYSLHPQWLLDSAPSNWYGGSGTDFNADDGHSTTNTSLGFDEVICTDNKTDETGWTEEEKTLLDKGLEIFGKSSIRLSQFISSKTPAQVKYYLKHFYSVKNLLNPSYLLNNVYSSEPDVQQTVQTDHSELPKGFSMSDIIEDAQIPASIEEVIAVVSTAKPTVNMQKKMSKKKTSLEMTKSISKNSSGLVARKKQRNLISPRNVKRERKIMSKMKWDLKNESMEAHLGNRSAINNVNNRILQICSGEEVIKIKKESSGSESDLEIDVDVDDVKKPIVKTEVISTVEENRGEQIVEDNPNEMEQIKNKTDFIDLQNIDETTLKFLTSEEIPLKPLFVKENDISDVEKFVHCKFFEGRPSKTPIRYLKIRNHIIDYWLANKPSYCTKTSVRQGLKNCGDVNCIGRIHQYLEQIGVINFGCAQTNYVRPLLKVFGKMGFDHQTKEKMNSQSSLFFKQREEIVRPRMKKKYNNDGEGGYTMTHNENGDIIETTIINKEKQIKPRNRRQDIKLVYCKSFSDDYMAPFKVNLHISALLTIDLHAHSAMIEVMGLLGGKFDEISRNLHVTCYIPCKGTDYSNTHCDMCPVSQSEASETIQSEGLEVIGWFHSHPTFFPNPSQQDIDTQLNMQLYLNNKYSPFVGVILSPFRPLTITLASEYRCLIVDKNHTKDGRAIPYKFPVNITSKFFDVQDFLKRARYIFMTDYNVPKEYRVDFQKPYFQDKNITFLEKLLASLKLHLARCTNINKMTCDAIIHGITDICLKTD